MRSVRRSLAALLSLFLAVAACSGKAADPPPAGSRPLPQVRNPGFEGPGTGVPEGWFQDASRTGDKGRVFRDRSRVHSGEASVRLEPNARNGGDQPLAIAQVLDAVAFRGRTVRFSGHLAAEAGATAALGLLSIVRGKPTGFAYVSQGAGGPAWAERSQAYEVPDDPSVQLVLTCYVAGTGGAAWFDDVSLALADEGPSPAPNPPVRDPRGPPPPRKATVDVDASRVLRQIPRTLFGANVEWIWNGNLLWDDVARRPNPEVERLTRDLGVSLLRYPGGLYSDFYHWRDGVGPLERRPEVQHDVGKKDRSRPAFGTDEALEFARRVGGELLLTVNAGTGTPEEAADWVRYVNRDELRVRYWEVGNELYIRDGSPVSRATTMPPDRYSARFREFARAMRAADPRIRIGAIGGENQGRYAVVGYPDWNRTVLERAGDEIDFLAVHNAYAPVLVSDAERDVRTVYAAMLAAPALVAKNLDTLSRQVERFAPTRAARITLAVTEWGPVFQYDPGNRYVDHAKTLGSALFVASALKAFVESTRTEIANFFLLNDVSVLGMIRSRDGSFPPRPDWAPSARYFAFQMFTRHFGPQLVASSVVCPTFDSTAIGLVDAVQQAPWLEVVASLDADGRHLYLLAINKHFDQGIEADVSIRAFPALAAGTAWTMEGTGIDAHTGTTPLRVPGLPWASQAADAPASRFLRGGSSEVTLASRPIGGLGGRFTYVFPPRSVTSLVLTRAK
jgi:alpha-N-arabinofuranosidase